MIYTNNNNHSGSILSIIIARVFYSVNWFNISSIFYLIVVDFREDISMLGIITTAFYIGIGLFQIPSGILAAKYSALKIATVGIIIASSAVLLSGLSGSLLEIAILRFIVGLGMALFFGPSVIAISTKLGNKSEGYGIGLLNSAHALGGIIGIFGWIFIAQIVGWRISIIIGGTIGLITAFMLYVTLIQKDKTTIPTNDLPILRPYFQIKLSDIMHILSNKYLISLGLILIGFQIVAGLTSTFTVYYLNKHLEISALVSGLVGSLPLLMNFFFSPLFGKLYDKIKMERLLFIIVGTVSISVMATDTLYLIIISIIVSATFLSGGFVMAYAKAKQISKSKPNYQTLAVSYVNGIGLFGGFWVPLLFSFVVESVGYSTAWLLAGLIPFLIIMIPIIKLKQ